MTASECRRSGSRDMPNAECAGAQGEGDQFGIIYGIGVGLAATQLASAGEEAYATSRNISNAFPGYPSLYGRENGRGGGFFGRHARYVKTLFGREMPLPGHQGLQRSVRVLQRTRRIKARLQGNLPPNHQRA